MSEQAASTKLPPREGYGIEYGPYYYRHDCGIPYERNEHWLSFFAKVADGIVRDLRPASVLDAGCAMGFLVEALRERGVEAWGIDISKHAISQVHESVAEYCNVGSLTEPLTRRYDLIVCVEVLEHIPPSETNAAIANLCNATDRLLLSTTPNDYAEATHLNVQPPESWSAALASEGFVRDVERDASYITPWAALYTRTEESLPEIVRRYDRAWWRLRSEADQLRNALLATQAQLAELEYLEGENRHDLLASQGEEILRLRDLLVSKDIELGAAKGRLTELKDRWQRITGAAVRIESRVPIFGKPVAAALRMAMRRMLRGQQD